MIVTKKVETISKGLRLLSLISFSIEQSIESVVNVNLKIQDLSDNKLLMLFIAEHQYDCGDADQYMPTTTVFSSKYGFKRVTNGGIEFGISLTHDEWVVFIDYRDGTIINNALDLNFKIQEKLPIINAGNFNKKTIYEEYKKEIRYSERMYSIDVYGTVLTEIKLRNFYNDSYYILMPAEFDEDFADMYMSMEIFSSPRNNRRRNRRRN